MVAGTGEVASFGVATRLAGVALRLPSSAFGAALPVLSQEAQRGQAAPAHARFAGALQRFAIGAAAVLIVGASPIVRFAYGSEFAAAATPLVLAGLGLLPTLVNSGRKVYLNASGREHAALRWSAATFVVQIAACLLLIPRYGAAGAMAGLALGEAAIWLPLRMEEADRFASKSLRPSRCLRSS